MAGFLRKKDKPREAVKPVPSAPLPLVAAVSPPPPLFARFATSTKSSTPANQRVVSSPMVLSSNVRKQVPQKAVSRGSAAPTTRDLDVAKRRTSTAQNQSPNKSVPPIQLHSEQPSLSPSYHAPIQDKPLPPPIPPTSSADPSGSTPTQSFMLGSKQSRAPPSALQNQQPPGQPRALLNQVGDRESKQFFQPASSQSYYSVQMDESLISNHASRPPMSSNNDPFTSSSRRNSVLSTTNVGPQMLPPIANRKMQQNPPASFGRQILPTTDQTQPHLFRHSVANQDLQPTNGNGDIGVSSNGTSLLPYLDEIQETPLSDRGVNLPPLFHAFNPEDRNSVPVPRSSSRPSLPPNQHHSESDMGLASSHTIGNGLLPSFAHSTSLYNNPSNSPPGAPLLNPHFFPPRTQAPSNKTQVSLPQDLNLQSSGSPRKSSINLPAPTVPMKGKPRIFAAMAAQEDELDQMPGFQPPPQPIQSPIKKRPSQSSIYVQQPQPQHQPSAPELSAYTNGSDLVKVDLTSQSQPPFTPKFPIFEQLPPTPPSRSLRSNGTRPILRQDERPKTQLIPHTPPRVKKLSKARTHSDVSSMTTHLHHPNGSNITLPGTPDSHHRGGSASIRTLTKSRPTTPVTSSHKPLFASTVPDVPLEPAIQLDEDTISNAGIPLDDDPFARVEGVRMLKPSNLVKEQENMSNGKKHRNKQSSKGPSISSQTSLEDSSPEEERKDVDFEKTSAVVEVMAPPTPTSPEEHRKTKKKHRKDDSQTDEPTTSTSAPPPTADGEDAEPDEPEPIPRYTMAQFLSDPQLLSSLLTFLSFYDWCILSSLSKEIRILLVRTPELRETVLERFLKTVGYSRWIWDDPDPLSLSLQDLSDYMRGVSTPTHEYARVAGMHVHSLTVHPNHRDPSLLDTLRVLTASTRAYNRVILRLRAQAEKEAVFAQQARGATFTKSNFNSPSPARGTSSRISSRAPSPTASSYSHSHSYPGQATPVSIQQNLSQTSLPFRSPLFRLRRAPLLRVFVPSPEGDWLSDKSVLACEAECKRAGVMHLMRLGDVVWDVAVGDEGNVGRLVWDGSYLIDLDYTYSAIGDLPKYMPALTFPPSYFHRVIRTGPNVSNPIVHIDISPWGEEIAMNLQLLQDRVRTETPQGAYHNVVRWVNRSSFVIRPPRGPPRFGHQGGKTQLLVPRIQIPDTDNLFVDSGWYGTIVVETEGTNEALADLQERCGPGVFPPRSRGVNHLANQAQIENKKVFRILREKSRPGEIWIKAVGIKERLL